MAYKSLFSALAALTLAACQSAGTAHVFPDEEAIVAERQARILATAPHPNYVGQPEWYEWVGRVSGAVDAEGHGPDPGSTEWCHAVNYRLTGHRADETVACDRTWERQMDRILRSGRGILDLL